MIFVPEGCIKFLQETGGLWVFQGASGFNMWRLSVTCAWGYEKTYGKTRHKSFHILQDAFFLFYCHCPSKSIILFAPLYPGQVIIQLMGESANFIVVYCYFLFPVCKSADRRNYRRCTAAESLLDFSVSARLHHFIYRNLALHCFYAPALCHLQYGFARNAGQYGAV